LSLKPLAASVFSILALVICSGCLGAIAPPTQAAWQISSPGKIDLPHPDQPAQPQCCLTQSPPEPQKIEIPGITPTLRPYNIDKTSDIWHSKDASSYITPGTPLVQFYALTGETPQIFYVSDSTLYPDNPDQDMWQNADYTLFTGSGDCEDLAIAKVSILRAKGLKAMVIGGYLEDYTGTHRDFWYEYYEPTTQQKYTILTSDSAKQGNIKFNSLYMFNDNTQWSTYDKNWNIN
jgi:hypothetical protein